MDIMSKSSAPSQALTPFAKEEGERMVYPALEEPEMASALAKITGD